MGYEKEKLDKLLEFVETVYKDPGAKAFAAGIDALVLSSSGGKIKVPAYSAEKLDAIYEYCLARKLRAQAEGFYRDFPMSEMVRSKLVEDYILMEEFRRKDMFPQFCHYVYRQIEAIINAAGMDPKFDNLTHQMYQSCIFVDRQTGVGKRLDEEVFGVQISETDSNSPKAALGPVKDMSMWKKFEIVLILIVLGFRGKEPINPITLFSFKKRFSPVYQLRIPAAHAMSDKDPEIDPKTMTIYENRYTHYHSMTSFLLDFVEGVRKNYPLSDETYSMVP